MNVEDNKGNANKIVNTKRYMTVITAGTLREIVSTANDREIRREDVVSLLKDNGQFHLVYFE